ncbi:ThuA domain-containing protein [Stratiformator vulcanicus]|uniref:Trehalose utilization n=1 Tax=Stratiformator vulcanicus TaxID=2527980 RepID=A0A517R0S9_9PLAN|nr:ThuA domain-containing protein [Stratiformator vulcanicus]QDT37456.1 Trehalose utilization [Stratiformator vulcanicus]
MSKKFSARCLATLLASVVVAASLMPAVPAFAGETNEKPRILFLTQSAGFRHGSVTRKKELSPAEIAIKQLAQTSGEFTVDCTQDAELDITQENLANYDIVMLYTTGKLPIGDEDLDYFLGDWLKQKGHGVIGVHSASDTYKKYKPYWDMIGGTFAGHPWTSRATVSLTVHDTEFPAMKPFVEEFGKTVEWQDEIYQYKNWQPEKVRVLMSIDMASTKIKKPYHVPVAWAKEYGEGKIYYNNLGHREQTWTRKPFLDSIVMAVKWINGEVDGDATPNPEVSAAEEAKAKKAVEGN